MIGSMARTIFKAKAPRVNRTASSAPPSDASAYCRDLGNWPRAWMDMETDLRFRQSALECSNDSQSDGQPDLVEAVMVIEEVLGTEIPDSDANDFGSPQAMVDWLELHLSNQRPNKEACAWLRKLAKGHNDPLLPKAWKAHGDESKLPPSSSKSSGNRRF